MNFQLKIDKHAYRNTTHSLRINISAGLWWHLRCTVRKPYTRTSYLRIGNYYFYRTFVTCYSIATDRYCYCFGEYACIFRQDVSSIFFRDGRRTYFAFRHARYSRWKWPSEKSISLKYSLSQRYNTHVLQSEAARIIIQKSILIN